MTEESAMHPKRVILVLPNLIKSNGGTYAAYVFVRQFASIGSDVHVMLTAQTRGDYIRNWMPTYPLGIDLEKIVDLRSAQLGRLVSRAQEVFARAFRFLDRSSMLRGWLQGRIVDMARLTLDRRAFSLLSEADIILFVGGTNDISLLKAIRSRAKGVTIATHFGPPELLEFEFSESDDVEASRRAYIEWLTRYDYLWFESARQAAACEAIHESLRGRSVVVPPGLDEAALSGSTGGALPLVESDVNIVCVGSIQPRKGHHLVIEAFKEVVSIHPNAKLHIVGRFVDRSYRQVLKYLIRLYGLGDRVVFHGELGNEYLEFIRRASIVVQPSYAEGVSTVIREALFFGRPIVAFEISGTTEALESRRNAILVRPFSAHDFGEAIKEIIADESLAEMLRYNARATFVTRFSSAAVRSQLIEQMKALHDSHHR